ncbi:hypothetical protein HID58_055953, partial [Brassica napus]
MEPSKEIFLLLMDDNLAGVMQGMSLEDDDIEWDPEKPLLQDYIRRQHNTNLSTDIMPLFAPSIPPGFVPPAGLIAPEVFEQMQLYMNCIDPEERRIREFRMKKAWDELSKDSIAQRACLRMENAPMISGATNKDKGLVFDYRRVTVDTPPDVGESSEYAEIQRRKAVLPNTIIVATDPVQRSSSETRFDRVQSRGYDRVENCAKRRPRSNKMKEARSECLRFQFLAALRLGVEHVREVINRGWNLNNSSGQASVSERIRFCRQELSKWKRSANVNSNINISRLRKIAVEYFTNLFTSSNSAIPTELLEGMTPR